MLKQTARSFFKTLSRLFPRERGKFRLLNEIYFKFLSPKGEKWITSSLSYGLRMKINIAEFLQAHLYLFGSYELPTVKFIRSFLSQGGTALDIGAQIGYLTLVCATAGERKTRVFSFEPEPVNIGQFQTNVGLNNLNNVTLVPKAVSSQPGVIKLYLSNDFNSGTHSTIADDPNVSSQFVEVPCITLDDFVSENDLRTVDLIKIDVEGAELEVIQGAANILQSKYPTLIIELSEGIQASRGYSTPAFNQMMSDFGYSPYLISDNGTL